MLMKHINFDYQLVNLMMVQFLTIIENKKKLHKPSIHPKIKESKKSKGEYVERLLNINNKQKF